MNETEILQYAIKGYEQQQAAIEERIRELRAELEPEIETVHVFGDEQGMQVMPPKRQFSAVTRKRMARAQRLRWQKRSA